MEGVAQSGSRRSSEEVYFQGSGTDAVGNTRIRGMSLAHCEHIKNWLKTHLKCLWCKRDIDNSSLFSWKDRAVKECRSVIKDAILGGSLAVTIPVLMGIKEVARQMLNTAMSQESKLAIIIGAVTLMIFSVKAVTVVISKQDELEAMRTIIRTKTGMISGLVAGSCIRGISNLEKVILIDVPKAMFATAVIGGFLLRRINKK